MTKHILWLLSQAYIYQNGFQFYQMGYASAAAMVLFAIVLIMTLAQYALQNRWVHYAERHRHSAADWVVFSVLLAGVLVTVGPFAWMLTT